MARLELVPPAAWHTTRDRSRPGVLAERRARTVATPSGPVVVHGPETLRHALQEVVRVHALRDPAEAQGWLDALVRDDALVLSSAVPLREVGVEDSAGVTVATPFAVPGLAWAWRAPAVAVPVALRVDGARVTLTPALRAMIEGQRRVAR